MASFPPGEVGFGAGEVGCQVFLHIYDVSTTKTISNLNAVTKNVGGGVFHSGVELFGREWSFGFCEEGSGVFCCAPRSVDVHVYRETVRMGWCPLNESEVARIVGLLQRGWPGQSYDLLRRNCCTFSDELCQQVGVGPIPAWVNRFAHGGAALADGSAAAVAKAKEIDRDYALSEKAKAAAQQARELDQQYAVSETVAAHAEAARVKALQLDAEYQVSATAAHHARELDEQYEIRRRASEATAAAGQGLMMGASWLQATAAAAFSGGGGSGGGNNAEQWLFGEDGNNNAKSPPPRRGASPASAVGVPASSRGSGGGPNPFLS